MRQSNGFEAWRQLQLHVAGGHRAQQFSLLRTIMQPSWDNNTKQFTKQYYKWLDNINKYESENVQGTITNHVKIATIINNLKGTNEDRGAIGGVNNYEDENYNEEYDEEDNEHNEKQIIAFFKGKGKGQWYKGKNKDNGKDKKGDNKGTGKDGKPQNHKGHDQQQQQQRQGKCYQQQPSYQQGKGYPPQQYYSGSTSTKGYNKGYGKQWYKKRYNKGAGKKGEPLPVNNIADNYFHDDSQEWYNQERHPEPDYSQYQAMEPVQQVPRQQMLGQLPQSPLLTLGSLYEVAAININQSTITSTFADIDDSKVTVHTGDMPYIEQFGNKKQLHSRATTIQTRTRFTLSHTHALQILVPNLCQIQRTTDTSSTWCTQGTVCSTTGLRLHSIQSTHQQEVASSHNPDRRGDNYRTLLGNSDIKEKVLPDTN
eukprot:2631243-Amphidinium_carterae.2